MLTIRNKGQTEALSHYTDYESYEEVNGALELSLTSFSAEENPGHSLIENEVRIQSKDGRDFRIKQLREEGPYKELTAISTIFDLNTHNKEGIYAGTRTFNQFADYLFAGTGWTYQNVDVSGLKFIPNYGNGNFIVLLEQLLAAFECERQIMPGNHVLFAKQLGPDNDAQYRRGHNIQSLSRSVDTSKLEMVIKGIGADGLEVVYVSPHAGQFPHISTTTPRVITDERFTIAKSLLEHIAQEITDVPEVIVELDATELDEKELGERVWVIDEVLGIGYQSRVLAKTTREPKENSSAIVGNTTPKKMTDSLVDQTVEMDENAKQNQTRFEQTNEHILLVAERFDGEIREAYAEIEITADNIREEVGAIKIALEGGIADSVSLINQTALAIRQEVTTKITYLDGRIDTANSVITQTAASIRSEINQQVTHLDGRIDTSNSSISQLSGQLALKASTTSVTTLGSRITNVEIDMNSVEGQISSKVSMADITGQVIASKINQTAANISISAQAIDLLGIVRVANSIDLGYSGNGATKAIRFNGNNAWIYSSGDFSLTIDASYARVVGNLFAASPAFGQNMPVVTGTSAAQALSIGLSPNGELVVYRANGTGVAFGKIRDI